MPRLTFKNLAAHKGRTVLTALAVLLGIAMVAGTYVLTDTTNAAFDDIFSDSLKGTDVVVTSKENVQQQDGSVPAFPDSYLKTVRSVPGVKLAAGTIFSAGAILDSENESVGSGFSPQFISSVLPGPLESLNYVKGHQPDRDDEASIDEAGADRAGLEIGDKIKLVGTGRARSFTLVGLSRLGSTSFGGTTISQVTLPMAQLVTGKVGKFDQISIAAEPGVSSITLRDRVRRALPDSARVETAAQNADRQSDEIEQGLSFLTTILLAFALISLLVGSFVIFNVFSITVAQRTREFGMLRTLGASRRQVLGAVLIEGVLIGVLGSILGILVGLALAKGLSALMGAVGAGLPSTSMVIAPRTIIVSLVIGIGVTLISSLVPAIRSTRVPPIAALTEAELPPGRRRGLIMVLITAVFAVVGVLCIVLGLFGGATGGSAAGLLGGGAVAIVIGVSLYSPQLVRPMASVIGRPLEKLRGLTGRLARENSQRKPSRTAVTAAALMIGLALVTFATVFASGVKSSIAHVIDTNLEGQITLQDKSGGFLPIPAGAVRAAGEVPGVQAASGFRSTTAKLVGGGDKLVTSIQPATAAQVLSLDWKQGSGQNLTDLRDGQAIVSEGFADGQDLEVGDSFRMLTQSGRRPKLTVAAILASGNLDLFGAVTVTERQIVDDFGVKADADGLIKVADGEDVDTVKKRVEDRLRAAYPTVEVLNQSELKSNSENQVNGLLTLIYALLALAIVVSLMGIVVTLVLSIRERTRELGMLRAVGMSRRQVRRMIRYEAVITAVIGAVLGMILGLIFAALVGVPLKDEGFTLSYPVATLILILVLTAVAGVLAAVYPARKAAKLDVLEAISYE